jgi:hypothetical protein
MWSSISGATQRSGLQRCRPYTDATDEQVGPGTSYTLYIDRFNTGNDANFVEITVYNATNGLGADIDPADFDILTGDLTWTPNNADVGTHRFKLVHDDGHGDTDDEIFLLTIRNAAIDLTVPPVWDLTEDDTNPADYTLPDGDIDSTDEGQGAEYVLVIDGKTWTPGYHPNGSQGGEVVFDKLTGEIQWQTTNADVKDGYKFEIIAVDTNGDSDSKTMIVNVHNDPTSINDIPDQTATEDGIKLHVGDGGVLAKDERVGGAFYTLEIQRIFSDGSTTSLMDVKVYNANNGLGADIFFNNQTGEINWATDNRDVGEYNFVVTHNDTHGSTATDDFKVTVENKAPQFTTEPPDDYVIVPATLKLTYDPWADDEGQHDWARYDQVTYSLTSSPPGMQIDPLTGLIDWTAPGILGGEEYTITILVEDGNGGSDIQSFVILIDASVQDIPWEARDPFSDFGQPTELGTGNPHGDNPGLKLPKLESIPNEISLRLPAGEFILDLLRSGEGFEDILEQLNAGGRIVQPDLEPGGSVVSPTKLWGFLTEGLNGRRLDFNLDDAELWNELVQPTLDIGGSVSPDTPLEGHAQAVAQGKRLNFDFFPIEEATALQLDDLKVGDLLKL